MADRPTSPFAGLDKALLRQTREASQNASEEAQKHASIEVATPTSIEEQKHGSADLPASNAGRLHKVGYYFTQDEIDVVDELHHELRKKHRLNLTKSDVVRLAVAFLDNNYRDKQDQSYLLRQAKKKHTSKEVQK
jgi:hypothetical protein